MYDFFEMLMLVDLLFHNLVFGIMMFFLGVTLFLGTMVISNSNAKGVHVVKTVGFTATTFFVVPGLVALFLSIMNLF